MFINTSVFEGTYNMRQLCVCAFFFYLDDHFIVYTHKPKMYSNPLPFEKKNRSRRIYVYDIVRIIIAKFLLLIIFFFFFNE